MRTPSWRTPNKKKYIFVLVSCTIITTLFYCQNLVKVFDSKVLPTVSVQKLGIPSVSHSSKYLVKSLKCKILNLDPFDPQAKIFHRLEKYIPCTKQDLLTYVTKDNNVATLWINHTVLPYYSKNQIVCSYANVTRIDYIKDADNHFGVSRYVRFNDSVALKENFVSVKCEDTIENKSVYENVHATVLVRNDVLKKIQNFNNKTKPFSVLFLGIDSISRLNFIRNLPNSYKFLMDHEWISLHGYNKIDDNTFPNIMAILTGFRMYEALRICQPNRVGMLDRCPLLWYDFRKFGYVTGYAEDDSWISTFNHEKKGFLQPPTDYYFRPYIMKTEKLKYKVIDDMKYCTGPETTGERMLNLAKDFAITFKDTPNFGLFWMNSFSHNSLNAVSRMDDRVKKFLEEITDAGVLENSVVIFLSDHGLRVGKFRETAMGWLEERLPFIHIWIPETFKERFPAEYTNLKKNVNKLTSPFDLFLTLQHLLLLSGFNYKIKSSDGCPNCKSLFTEIESERSCEDAGIARHWCTCADFDSLGRGEERVVREASAYLLQRLNDVLNSTGESDKCAKYSIDKVTKAGVSRSYDKDKFFLLTVKTEPKAFFEATLVYKKHEFELSGDISRLDKYEPHSKCTHDAQLKKYCYCLNSMNDNSTVN